MRSFGYWELSLAALDSEIIVIDSDRHLPVQSVQDIVSGVHTKDQ